MVYQNELTSSSLSVLIVAIALCCLVTILLVVLLVICIRYKTRKRSISESTSALKLTKSKSEASKFYIVESSVERGLDYGHSEHQLPSQASVSLLPLTHDIILDMKANPFYHQLRTEARGVESPDSVLSQQQSCNTLNSSPTMTGETSTSTEEHILTLTFQPEENHRLSPSEEEEEEEEEEDIDTVNEHHRQPIRDMIASLEVNPSRRSSRKEEHFTRTLSDIHLDITRQESYGPLYSQVQFHSTKALSILEIESSNVITMGTLGMGQFGQVHLGHTHNLSANELGLGEDFDRSQTYEVAVKFLNENATQGDMKSFQKEVKYMSKLRHKNVVQILAVCWQEQKFIVLEYMKNGDLQLFLQFYSSVNMGQEIYNNTISYYKLIYIILQIANAMRFLSSQKFIHRDLACRNCLVGENFLVKVADFGLSKNLYNSCYYRFHGSALLPIRWMAPECFYGRFSEKTDVWAFGVTMWEVFNICRERPYNEETDQQIVQGALNGTLYVLDKPKCCTVELYQVMESCLRNKSDDRPGFEDVYTQLLSLDITSHT